MGFESGKFRSQRFNPLAQREENISDYRRQPVSKYFFKVNNKNTKKRCEIRSKLTTKTAERRR